MSADRLKSTLFISGAFACAYNASVFIHESGHALACWATGGAVERITLHPFSWSYTYYASDPSPKFTAWAGAVFSTIVGWLLIGFTWRSRRAIVLPLLLTGVIAGAMNGVYLSVDTLATAGGDGTILRELGTPCWLIIGVGAIMAVIALSCIIMRNELIRMDAHGSTLQTTVTAAGGIGPYLLAMLAYHWIFNRPEFALWAGYVGIGMVLLPLVVGVAGLLRRRWTSRSTPPVLVPGWMLTMTMFGLGIFIVAAELLLFQHN